MKSKIWDKWENTGPIYACNKHMDKVKELKAGKNRLYCPYCKTWWKTDPKLGVLRHQSA